MKKYLWLLSTALLIQGCGNKEIFSPNKAASETTVNSALQTSSTLCSTKTHIKAPVDVLVLFDNSPSSNAFNATTRARLTSMIQGFVQDNFDYHIMVAPLVTPKSENYSTDSSSSILRDTSSAVIFASDASSLNASVQSKLRPTSSISSISFPVSTGNEYSIKRAYEIIQANRANGVFRNNAYTMIAVLTNGNDTQCTDSKGYSCGLSDKLFYNSTINQLTCLGHNTPFSPAGAACSGTSLDSSMFRFISLSPKTTSCGTPGTYYHYASNEIFNNGLATRSYVDSNPMIMSSSSVYNDARDFCNSSADIFSHIRSSIKDVVLKHKYNRWPVAESYANIDTSTIKVKLIGPTNNVIRELTNNSGVSSPSNGFSYAGVCTISGSENCNTRYYPTPGGEPFPGHVIRLHGSDEVEFPNCLSVEYYAPTEVYRYVYLPYGTPREDTLELYVNNQKIEKSTTNGWEYIGNQCASSLTDGKVLNLPASGSCGPILRLNGTSAVTTKQGSSISVRVDYISM